MTIKSTTIVGDKTIDSKDFHKVDYLHNQQTQPVEQVVEDKLPPVSRPDGTGLGNPTNPRKERALKKAIKKDLQTRNLN